MMNDNDQASPEIELLPYYVYEFLDPRDNKVFYVGKGTNNRINRNLDPNNNDNPEDNVEEDDPVTLNALTQRYLEIKNQGLDIIRVIVGRFQTETEAFAVEAVLIKWIYGFKNLTNQVHGHRSKNIRDHKEKVDGKFSIQPGLDRQRRLPGDGNTGEYTEDQRKKISENMIVEKLEALKENLILSGCFQGISISDPDYSVSADPCLILSGFVPESVQIQIKVQLLGDKAVLNLIPRSNGLAHRESFVRVLTTNIREPYNIKKGNRYGIYTQTHNFKDKRDGMYRGVEIENLNKIIRLIKETLDRLNTLRT